MKTSADIRGASLPLFLWLVLFSVDAHAYIDNVGLLDNVLDRYSTAASSWAATITTHATWLFWTLALISMVWTFGIMALRKADIGEFFAEFVRFTIFTGFFWWLLVNGPNFATSIMNSLRQIGGTATGTGSDLTPSGIVDIGFEVFAKVLVKSSIWSPIDSATGIFISIIILIVLALIGVNMLLLLVSAWILAYAGVFFLGFGGSRWTSDMAIHYFKTILSVAAQLFTMVLLVGIGKSFIDQFYTNISAGMNLNELAVMLIVAVVLLALVNKVPSLVGNLAMGGGTGSLGGGLGAGAVVGAAAMGAAAAATTGAALVAGAANIGGGAQALMAAFSKANAAASAGGSSGDWGAAAGGGSGPGGNGSGGGSALAAAMGDNSSGNSFGTGQNGSASSGPANFAGPASKESIDSQDSTTGSAGNYTQNNGPGTNPDAKEKYPQDNGAPGRVKSTTPLAAAGAAAAKVGKVTVGTATNLAQGSWDVTKAKGHELVEAAMDRIGETVGGKIATAIKASDTSRTKSNDSSAPFDNDSLSNGKVASLDAAAEVAAFRDRDPKSI
jgi:type IV secretion system protein TrbL